MTRTQALAKHLLAGKTVSIMTAYQLFGISNISRELRRLIEIPYNLTLTRTQKEGRTKYGSYCQWLEYRLAYNKINEPGIKKLKQVVSKKETSAKKVARMKAKV